MRCNILVSHCINLKLFSVDRGFQTSPGKRRHQLELCRSLFLAWPGQPETTGLAFSEVVRLIVKVRVFEVRKAELLHFEPNAGPRVGRNDQIPGAGFELELPGEFGPSDNCRALDYDCSVISDELALLVASGY